MWIADFIIHAPFKELAIEGVFLFKYTDVPIVQRCY